MKCLYTVLDKKTQTGFFFFFVQWDINLYGLFTVKAILVEGQ